MVLPFIGASIVTGIGAVAGLSLGPYIFSGLTKPYSYQTLRAEADIDNTIPAPDPGLMVKTEFRNALPLLEPWITEPDYERVSMMNRLLSTVWPTTTQAILDLALQGDMYNTVVYPQVKKNVFDKYAFVEDIFLGSISLRHGRPDPSAHASLASKLFQLGAVAPRLGGMRVVPTADDEVLLETSLSWGSQATLDVTAILRFGRLRLVVPLQLANLSFKADVRVLLRPLVEKFPCLGGVSLSLLRVPTVDFKLVLLGGVDLMALPGLPGLIHTALRVALEPMTLPLLNKPLVPGLGLVLPNAVAFPIMPKFGLPDPPVGAIRVTINQIEGIRGGEDIYVCAEVRRGRYQQTRTVANTRNPVFEEEFALIVDSLESDTLRLQVFNDDMGWNDTLLSELVLPFGEAVVTGFDQETGAEVTDFRPSDFVLSGVGKTFMMPLKKYKKAGRLLRLTFSPRSASINAAAGAATGAPASSRSSISLSSLSRIFTRKKTSKRDSAAAGSAAAAAAAVSSGGEGEASSGSPGGSMVRNPTMSRNPSGAVVEGTREDIGTIKFKVEFVPFNKPDYDDVAAERAEKATRRDPYLSLFPPPPGRTLAMLDAGGGGGGKLSYGVLTVQLVRCIDLAPEGAKDLATYVRMTVTNDERDEKQTSSTILNETSPRWGDKFDFVLIPASSELHIQVFNKTGMLGNLVGSLFKRKEEKDTVVGKVMINVEEVARNGHLKETWSLQDAERGYIELNITWQTCHLSKDQRRG